MGRKALVIGIDKYPNCPLAGCVNDAREMAQFLARNGDDSRNFDVRTELDVRTVCEMRIMIRDLFSGAGDVALLYFSGHGTLAGSNCGYIVSPDYAPGCEGVSLREILSLANGSKYSSRVIILDCCNAGNMMSVSEGDSGAPHIAPGVAIIAACRDGENALEDSGHGVVTQLMLDGLDGGAATVAGDVTPGGLYAYIDRSLGDWDQRPMFAANMERLVKLRQCRRTIPEEVLRRLTRYFSTPDSEYRLDPSYEFTNCDALVPKIIEPVADALHVPILKDLQKLERVGLVVPVGVEHMYEAAMQSKSCRLTRLGRHFWNLARNGRI